MGGAGGGGDEFNQSVFRGCRSREGFMLDSFGFIIDIFTKAIFNHISLYTSCGYIFYIYTHIMYFYLYIYIYIYIIYNLFTK